MQLHGPAGMKPPLHTAVPRASLASSVMAAYLFQASGQLILWKKLSEQIRSLKLPKVLSSPNHGSLEDIQEEETQRPEVTV